MAFGWHWNTSVWILKPVCSHSVNFVSQRITFCLLGNKEHSWLNCHSSPMSFKHFLTVFSGVLDLAYSGSLEPVVRIGKSPNSRFSDQWCPQGSLKVSTLGEFTPQKLAYAANQGFSLFSPIPKSQVLNISLHVIAWMYHWTLSMFKYTHIVFPSAPFRYQLFFSFSSYLLTDFKLRFRSPEASLTLPFPFFPQNKILFQTPQTMPSSLMCCTSPLHFYWHFPAQDLGCVFFLSQFLAGSPAIAA